MALTINKASSSNSSTSNSTQKWNFHVFLSFRGEDTRKGFTDHLYAALCSKGIKVFKDDVELERGEIISQKLLQAIESSLFAIVVLSRNYASSSWCLEELQKIIASRNEVGQQVFPIFYGVDPSDVRHQKRSFVRAFINHAKKFREDLGKVQKWRKSLTEVANLSGWDAKDWPEAKLIEKVVEAIWRKLHYKLPSCNAKLVGIDSKIDAIDSLLGIGLDDVRFVGIWGMGGVGKTTLARVVYDRLLNQFEICCFLSNIREISERGDGHVHLQKILLSHLKVKGMVIYDTHQGKKTIQNLCCNKKVLLILDDISSISQLENLAEIQEWFGAGSRIIITTRDMHLLISHGVHEIYEVKSMNKSESLQLFSQKAFRRDQPEEGYLDMSEYVVNYAKGLPLALKILGSFLCKRSIPEWKDILDKLKQDPNPDINKILKISYDRLEDSEKTIFLDIACFFKLWEKDKVAQILKYCGLHSTIGIRLLIEKSLLSEIVRGGKTYIDMHDLIQEMGRNIVSQECPIDPGKRSRLWSLKDIDKVLKRNIETEVIQGIFLPFNSHEAYWDCQAFSKMINLRLLIINCNLNLPNGLKSLSSALRVLEWNAYPLEHLPLGTQLDALVYLQMHHSKIKQLWDDRQCFENLKFMDLSYSCYLFKTPNFVGVPNLERLILEDCINLVEVHSSLGELKNLLVVNLKGCKNLKVLPRKLEMDFLKEFVLCGCTQIKMLPEFGKNMKNMVTLDLQETGIAKLPESLGFLISVEVLNLRGCKNLVCLPRTICNLKHLKILDISSCSKFSKLPENLNENEALEELDVSKTAMIEVPSSIGQLEKLKTLSFHRCKGSKFYSSWILSISLNKIFQWHSFHMGLVLPPSIFNLKSMTKLDLSYCNIDDGFIPDDLSGLSSLNKLNLSGNQFVNLPAACISNLLKLQYLFLNFCPKLRSLPQPSPCLSRINARESASLESLCNEELSHFFAPTYLRRRPFTEFIKDADVTLTRSRDLNAIMPGREIPSWFKNQNHFSLDERGQFSIIVCVPPYKLLGFALCVVIDDKLFDFEAKQRRFVPPICWEYEYSAKGPDGELKFHQNLAISRAHIGKGINSPHLWLLFRGIKIKNSELSKDHNILRFTFRYNYNHHSRPGIVKCGWRAICQENLEEWESRFPTSDGGIGSSSRPLFFTYHTLEHKGRCRKCQEILNESAVMSPEASSLYDLQKGKSDDSWTPSITDDASMGNKGKEKRIPVLNFKRKGESVLCKFEQATNSGPPNKKSKNAS